MPSPAQIAKGALRRLAEQRLEPTPVNYARAWAEEGGEPATLPLPPRARVQVERLAARVTDDAALRTELTELLMQGRWDGVPRLLEGAAGGNAVAAQAWAALIERIVQGVGRGGRQWTAARKKDSLKHVLDSSRSDLARLQQRLRQLVTGWDSDCASESDFAAFDDGAVAVIPVAPPVVAAPARLAPSLPSPAPAASNAAWPAVMHSLEGTVQAALPADDANAAAVADALAGVARQIDRDGVDADHLRALQAACDRARRLLVHRRDLVDQLSALCRQLTAGITEFSEDATWTQGQVAAMQERLGAGAMNLRSVHAVGDLLAQTRAQQQRLRGERDRARQSLKDLVRSLLAELGELDGQTGRFGDQLGHYAQSIAQADSLDSLAGLVREMVDQSRGVQAQVHGARERLQAGEAQASELTTRVRELEGELRKLSEEASTDALTQVANRRGLQQAFEAECTRSPHDPSTLAVGLIDIDNFKKLNDSLGHAAGDVALKMLAQRVRTALRPVDHIARFGGEEFVVLLPGTPVAEAQQVLTRLQRALTASLFMHDGQEVFVTFSGGVTAWRDGEALDTAIERADEALYEAKRTGKNRTCAA